MPRGRRPDIPSTIARSDKHAQEIYKKTHDSAVRTYGEGEAAHRAALASLKHSYRKEGDHWVAKARRGPSDPRAARSVSGGTSPREMDRIPASGGRVALMDRTKADLMQMARDLDIPGRSRMRKEELAEAVQAERARR